MCCPDFSRIFSAGGLYHPERLFKGETDEHGKGPFFNSRNDERGGGLERAGRR
jgi:hypothetical protein